MSKKVTIIVSSILLVYYIFTSGLWFFLTDCQEISKLTTPFSWALSAERTGLTGIATKDDINCVKWLLYKSDPKIKITGDSNAIFMITGYTELISDTWAAIGREDRLKTLYALPKEKESYIFLTSWNTRHKRYIETVDVGLRSSYPFAIDGSVLVYLTTNIDAPDQRVLIAFKVKEVYRSGDSVVYERVE